MNKYVIIPAIIIGVLMFALGINDIITGSSTIRRVNVSKSEDSEKYWAFISLKLLTGAGICYFVYTVNRKEL